MAAAGILIDAWTRTPFGRLDTRVALLLKYIEFKEIDPFQGGKSISEIREESEKGGALLRGDAPSLHQVVSTPIPGPAGDIPARIYTPIPKPALPLLVYFHGGGWIMGSLETHDALCRSLAKEACAIIISVDYRLAPEHPFPAALEDAYAALTWTARNGNRIKGNPNRLFVAGDSAGGNMAAALSIMARKKKGPGIAGQILIYPVTDISRMDRESYEHFGTGYFLTRDYMATFREMYLPDRGRRSNEYASPLLAESLKGLPPALVITAGFDVLKDEGNAYALRLKKEGVFVRHIQYQKMIHGFMNMGGLLPQAHDAVLAVSDFMEKNRNP